MVLLKWHPILIQHLKTLKNVLIYLLKPRDVS